MRTTSRKKTHQLHPRCTDTVGVVGGFSQETFSREDLETMGTKLGRTLLQVACLHGGPGHMEGYLRIRWPFSGPAPKNFAKGYMELLPSREILPAGTRVRISCAAGTHGEEGLRTAGIGAPKPKETALKTVFGCLVGVVILPGQEGSIACAFFLHPM